MEKHDTLASPSVGSHHLSKLQLGVSFRDLDCHGFITASQTQQTFLDSLLTVPRLIGAIFRPPSKRKVQILRNFEGMILPGEMLLVLGRPGSGCSTFLKALSGDTHGFHIRDEASINYQGTSYRNFHHTFKGERVYVAELDVHFPELTLGQTLNFAVSMRKRHPDPNRGREVSSLFGLSEAFDTQVGDALIRGISGGEKRRTSIAEAFIGGAQLQCWDNSTRGLDSLTARRFIQFLRDLTNEQRSTVVMSLYQASEDMYQSFDNVTLLYEGRQIYYGSVESAADYFVSLGFVRPSRATTADFLTSLTSPRERVIQSGYEKRVPRLPEEFSNVWKHSEEARMLRAKLDEFNSAHPINNGVSSHDLEKAYGLAKSRNLPTSTFPLSIPSQINACIYRAYLRLCKNIAADISSVVANTILGIIIGSVFYNLNETADSLQQRSLLLFFALMVNAFVPGVEVILMWAQRPIVEKQFRYAFYHPFTERLASIICDLPIKVLICFSIHIPIYFMANLRRSASAFFIYWLFMFTNLVAMSMLFRMIGAVSKTHMQTTTPVSIAVLLCIIYTGFIVPPDYMKPWLGWFWRINPLGYTYGGLLINETRDRLFPCSTMIPSGPSYAGINNSDKICTVVGSDTGQEYVEGSTYTALKYEYYANQLWRNFGILLAMLVAFFIAHLLASEYISAQPSKGEVLIFRHARSVKEPLEEDEDPSVVVATSEEVKQAENSDNVESAQIEAAGPTPPIPRQVGMFHWVDLNYEIKTQNNTRQILRDIHGWVQPGTLTALMGVTGAGKTSLLNVLADRATVGTVSGEIFVDRHARDASFRRKVGYVQQEDIHLATATVREALQFSALLRQPESTPKEEKLAYVESVLDMLDMQLYADAVVGVPGEGLNVEQRKRLTIAVEMVAKPELLLFLDEPTSGLDSQTAWSICTLLRKLADNGQTILCTIHQPSSQIFRMFDRLLLLDKGGTTLYFGDIGHDAATLIDYFVGNGAPTCHPGENPAEWMLEVTGNLPKSDTQHNDETSRWSEKWDLSPHKREVLRQLTELKPDLTLAKPLLSTADSNGREYAVSLFQQMIIVSKRIFQDQWRDPAYLISKIALSSCLALVNGISFYKSPLDFQGVVNLLFSVFLITQLFSCVDQLVIPHFINGRALFEARERNSKSYAWVVFVAANVLVELLWQTIIAVPIFAAWYYPTGLALNGNSAFGTAERGAMSFLLIWLFNLWSSTISHAFAAAFDHPDMAMHLATLFYWLALVFCGILASPTQLPGFWIFMYRVSPLTYFLEGLAVAGLADARITCSSVELLHLPLPPGAGASTCGEYLAPFARDAGGQVLNPLASADCLYCPYADVNSILASFGMNTANGWRDVGLMVVYVFFNVLMTFVIYWLARVPKGRRGAS
ncbi:ABC drug exporter AbcA [Annulohypoxylon bovei var. microspora]|nr:ABC drug exporter AbcA [Annulohypoxylon bovei var. microspora]